MLARSSVLFVALALPAAAFGQRLTLPPPGDNQKASVSQWIGPVEVTVTYNSPDVTGPSGEDRTGKIWGQLVPYGMSSLGTGTCGDQCPWRAGANQNTTFSVSHDVLVEGQPLSAGAYGLHMIPGETTWTLIFSTDSVAWGSFFYDPAHDALRVEVEPEEHPYSHWLDYEFVDRQPDRATVALQWENLQVPWTVEVPNVTDLYLATVAGELKGGNGFNWLSWRQAAEYALAVGRAELALEWAENAVSSTFAGHPEFFTLSTLAQAKLANGDAAGARETLDQAVSHQTATPLEVHFLGRQLLGRGQKELAMSVFEINAERHPGEWPVEVGLMRGKSALGRFEEALVHAEKALAMAPDEVNRTSLQAAIEKLRAGQDVN